MIDNVPVRFTKAWRSYFRGDIAGFDPETAASLIGGGVATAYTSAAAGVAPGGVTSQPVKPAKKNPGNRAAAPKAELMEPPMVDPLAGSLGTPAADDSPADDVDGGGHDSNGDEPGAGNASGDQSGADDDEKP